MRGTASAQSATFGATPVATTSVPAENVRQSLCQIESRPAFGAQLRARPDSGTDLVHGDIRAMLVVKKTK